MNKFISDAIDVCKKLEMSNDYDCKTELKSGEKVYFTMHLKGDYAVKLLHLAIGAAALGGVCLITSVTSAVKNRDCRKKK